MITITTIDNESITFDSLSEFAMRNNSSERTNELILHSYDDHPAFINNKNERTLFKSWWYKSKLHREEGPAIEFYKDNKLAGAEYWIDNKELSKTLYDKILKEVDELNITLQLIDDREWVRERGKRIKLTGTS